MYESKNETSSLFHSCNLVFVSNKDEVLFLLSYRPISTLSSLKAYTFAHTLAYVYVFSHSLNSAFFEKKNKTLRRFCTFSGMETFLLSISHYCNGWPSNVT